MEQKYEVLAVSITFLGELFLRGTVITKRGWKVQADAWNAKKAAAAPDIDIDTTFKHLLERKIIKELRTETVPHCDAPTKEIKTVKRERKERK